MRKALAVALACLLPVAPAFGAALDHPAGRQLQIKSASDGPPVGPLTVAAARAVRRLTAGPSMPDRAANRRDSRRSRSWSRRHPALLGAFIGAGVGSVTAVSIPEFACGGGDENCLFGTGTGALLGAGIGAGAGSLIGWLGSLGCR